MKNFTDRFVKLAAALGYTNAVIEQVQSDNTMMQFLAETDVEEAAFSKANTQFRKIITERDIGQPTPNFPPNPSFTSPGRSATGLFESISNLPSDSMLRPNYTDEIGALLDILVTPNVPPDPATVKKKVEGFAAETGSHFSVVAGNRQQATTFDVLIRRKGETNWTVAKTGSGKSLDVFVALTTPGVPKVSQVRIQLKKNNLEYGMLSDTISITINP